MFGFGGGGWGGVNLFYNNFPHPLPPPPHLMAQGNTL